MIYDSFSRYNTDKLNIVYETKTHDIVFSDRTAPSVVEHSIEADKDYAAPDRAQYVFSTIESPLYVMYPNGYTSEVRQKMSLTRDRNLIRFLDNRHDATGRGIFIVERFLFTRKQIQHKDFCRGIVERFNSLSLSAIQTSAQDIASMLYRIPSLKLNGEYEPLSTTFRVVTFIPERAIFEHRRIYHPDSGLLVGFGTISEKTQHPCNNRFVEDFKKLTCDTQNFIEVEIVDNHSNQEYWIKVGNKIFKLDPTRDRNRAEACHIDLHVNDTRIAKFEDTLDNINDHGIFHSRQEAETEGNLDAKIKMMEMENKQQAIENEKIKLSQEVTRLQNENQKLEIEKAKLSLDRYRINIDYRLTHERYQYELTKMILDVTLIKDKTTLFKYGAILDLLKKKYDMDFYIKNKEDKFSYSTENSFEGISSAQNVFTGVLKTAKLMADMF